ncbi:MAG: alpha/beta hydrolase [Caldilinea sp. CFX5]|nr:alpha/beta hydrolase [Caldilinea sp. CFX5]
MNQYLSSLEPQKRSRWQKMRRVMKTIGIVFLGLLLVGLIYEPMAEQTYVQTHQAPGKLFPVGDHQLHVHCTGSGSPTVVLEAGLSETSYSMAGWIAPAVAQATRVCVYDRAGYGWSEAANGVRDGDAVAADLHTLLAQAEEKGPYVLAGHSTGGAYVRVFAARYPEQVAGMVLLDSQPNEAFTRLPDYPAFYAVFHPVTKVLPYLAQVGIPRLLAFSAQTGLPAAANEGEIAAGATVHQYRAQRDEVAGIPAALEQAQSLQSLGHKPLIVVTALLDAQKGWLALQAEMTNLSTNGVQRVIPNATHASLILDKADAVASSQAILDVVMAVRTAQPLGNE